MPPSHCSFSLIYMYRLLAIIDSPNLLCTIKLKGGWTTFHPPPPLHFSDKGLRWVYVGPYDVVILNILCRKNYLELHIFYQSLDYSKIKKQPAYTWFALLCKYLLSVFGKGLYVQMCLSTNMTKGTYWHRELDIRWVTDYPLETCILTISDQFSILPSDGIPSFQWTPRGFLHTVPDNHFQTHKILTLAFGSIRSMRNWFAPSAPTGNQWSRGSQVFWSNLLDNMG
jgi:hypothetical protein